MNMGVKPGTNSVTVRAAMINDLREIVLLEQSVPNAAHWSVEQYENRIARGCVLVAKCGDSLAGFVCASVLPGEWEIENIVVQKPLRRRGIATALLESLFRASEKAGNRALHLEVRESNIAARQLYVKHGFRQVGRRPNYYHDPAEDAILYTRPTTN